MCIYASTFQESNVSHELHSLHYDIHSCFCFWENRDRNKKDLRIMILYEN